MQKVAAMITMLVGQLNTFWYHDPLAFVLYVVTAVLGSVLLGLPLELNSFLDRVLANVPDDKKDAVRAEYSRAQDVVRAAETTLETETAKVKTLAEQQADWWTKNKDAVVERDQLRTRVAAQPAPGSSHIDADAITKAIQASKDETMSTGLGLMTALNDLSMQHYKEFGGEVLNTRELTTEALKANKTLDVYYAEKVAAKRAEIATANQAKLIADAEARGRDAATKEILAKAGNAMPYPVGQTAPTTLAGLTKPAAGAANPYSLEAAVATANAVATGQTH